jgi:hypothetical protein
MNKKTAEIVRTFNTFYIHLKEKSVIAATGNLLLQTSVAAVNPLPLLVPQEEKAGTYSKEPHQINSFCHCTA